MARLASCLPRIAQISAEESVAPAPSLEGRAAAAFTSIEDLPVGRLGVARAFARRISVSADAGGLI
jgi:hypothetical protein